jgi:uncharacterized membrane protein/mono/diheme cytochrome c family protein
MNITNLIGHFHPLLVHLPIGILVLGILVTLASRFERWATLQTLLPFILFWGALSAICSCISGYLLSWSGDYNADLLEKHQWTGIALAVVSTAAWVFQRFNTKNKNQTVNTLFGLAMGGLLVVVGHYGGSLTHGLGYLTEGVFEKVKKPKVLEKQVDSLQNSQIQAILSPNILQKDSAKTNVSSVKNPISEGKTILQAAISTPETSTVAVAENPVFIYQDLIKPILEQRCYSCHGPNKSKADLRLDSPELIRQGGEDGVVLVAGSPEKSPLYSSLLLPLEDDKHMPPDGKPQLTEQQVQLIHFWIEKGASFDKTVQQVAGGGKSIPPSVSKPIFTQPTITNKVTPTEKVIVKAEMPDIKRIDAEPMILQQAVAAVNPADIQRLTKENVLVSNFGEKSNYVMVNFVNIKNYNSTLLDDLQSLQNQVVRLKLSNQPVTDNDLLKISKLKNLTRLNLEKTAITDAGLTYLKNLPNLEQLNIYGTNITDKGLEALTACKNLKVLYLWETKTTEQGLANFNKTMGQTVKVEMGGLKFHKLDTLKK